MHIKLQFSVLLDSSISNDTDADELPNNYKYNKYILLLTKLHEIVNNNSYTLKTEK